LNREAKSWSGSLLNKVKFRRYRPKCGQFNVALIAGRLLLCGTLLSSIAFTAWPQQKPQDLTSQSIEDLMNMNVTSVSKTQQSLSNTAAAVFVITPDDIERSGATDIPDLLRMVPGVDVAQINASTWAITVRGLNQRFGHELLALVDGRPVYTQSFGGVFWDVLDLPIEDRGYRED
jgi:iron complex outermembrane recepter protein